MLGDSEGTLGKSVFIAIVIESAIGPDELEPNNDRIDEICCWLYFDSIHLGFLIDDRASIKPNVGCSGMDYLL